MYRILLYLLLQHMVTSWIWPHAYDVINNPLRWRFSYC